MNLTINNLPAPLLERVTRRAASHHRSLEAEVLAILEAAVGGDSPAAVFAEIRATGLRSPGDSVEIVRDDRDRDGV